MNGPSDKFLPATILERRQIAPDLFILRVEASGPFSYFPGQYATIGIEIEGSRIERPYSLCSSPYEKTLEFFVERVPHGGLTPHLERLEAGANVLLRRLAKGRFTLDLRSGRKKHLLLATVTGIAPYVSYIRTLWKDWQKGGMKSAEHYLYCIHGASRSWEFGYREELEAYASEAAWLKYMPTISRPWEDPKWSGERGRADDLIRKYVDFWRLKPEETTGYLCGHPSMVEHGRGILERAGWSKEAMREELYFVPGKPGSAAR